MPTTKIPVSKIPFYHSLLGDASDNIPGVKGIGAKTAVALLNSFGNIDGIYKAIRETPENFTKPSILNALVEAKESIKISLQLNNKTQ